MLISNTYVKSRDGENFRTNRIVYFFASSYFFLAAFLSVSAIDIHPVRSICLMASTIVFALLLALPKACKFEPVERSGFNSAIYFIILFALVGSIVFLIKQIM